MTLKLIESLEISHAPKSLFHSVIHVFNEIIVAFAEHKNAKNVRERQQKSLKKVTTRRYDRAQS